MTSRSGVLASIPAGLRKPLISEYGAIAQNFLEMRWLPSELSGGRFSEIVYTILDGHARGCYAPAPEKAKNFVEACRRLENNAHAPRSFQVLIPRALPALYEIRNNRSIGHVGGDVDPNRMDSYAVLSLCSWILAELVRVFHGVTVTEAQKVVDALVEVRIPLVWLGPSGVRRVLRPNLKLKDQLLLLIASSVSDATAEQLLTWVEYKDPKYVMRTIRLLHSNRLVEFREETGSVTILPPGSKYVQDLIRKEVGSQDKGRRHK